MVSFILHTPFFTSTSMIAKFPNGIEVDRKSSIETSTCVDSELSDGERIDRERNFEKHSKGPLIFVYLPATMNLRPAQERKII